MCLPYTNEHVMLFTDIHEVKQTAFSRNPVVEQGSTNTTCSLGDGYPTDVRVRTWQVGGVEVNPGKTTSFT